MTALLATIGSRKGRRRATAALLTAALWLKAFVLAAGLAHPAQASPAGGAAAGGDLLAALRVICTSGGTKVLGGDGGAHSPADHDCARCCAAPAHGAVPALGPDLSLLLVPAAPPAVPRGAPPGGASAPAGHPRAPPPSIPV